MDRTPAKSRTVAVIDDDPSVRMAIASLLRSADFHVEMFDSAEDFLRARDSARNGCLIVDVRMPGMSGFDLQQGLAAEGRQRPTIFMSGHVDRAGRIQALNAGALAFLGKPFAEELLLAAVRAAFDD